MEVAFFLFLLYFGEALVTTKKMGKIKGARIQITLEHKCQDGIYRYHTTKNRRNTTDRIQLKKYSPVKKRHEIFQEIK